jgi:polynucleotide 5'-kinase involved in rRNA processing
MTRFPDDLQATISEVVASTTGRRSEGKPSVVCVSGGRGSGKNTHARVAANAILFAQGRVAVLDGDCANPLFGAPGVLTLSVFDEPIPAVGSPACFSERWLRRRAPLAAFFVGPTCARDNPAAYAASLERLTRAWARFRTNEDADSSLKNEATTVSGPTVLVVNCSGWSKGLGADLVMKTTQLTRATHALRFGAARRGEKTKKTKKKRKKRLRGARRRRRRRRRREGAGGRRRRRPAVDGLGDGVRPRARSRWRFSCRSKRSGLDDRRR